MSTPTQTKVKTPAIAKSSFTPVQTGLLQRKCACGGTSGLGGECEECRAERMSLQRSATNPSAPATVPPIVHDVLSSPGQPLDAGTRAFMEPRFGHDFSNVRIHSDARAAESARSVNALAYTVGRDVVFGAGQFAPQTSIGRSLLAHELTHTIQQSQSAQTSISKATSVSMRDPSDIYEKNAELQARRVMGGYKVNSRQIQALPGRGELQRQSEKNEEHKKSQHQPDPLSLTTGGYERETELHLKKIRLGPVDLEAIVKAKLDTSATHGEPAGKVAVKQGKHGTSIEAAMGELKTKYADIKVKGEVGVGKPGELKIEIGTKVIDFSVEISRENPLKIKEEFLLDEHKVEFEAGATTVEGKVDVILEVNLSPNILALRAAGQAAARLGSRAASAVQGALYTETGTATGLGIGVTVTAVAAAYIGWVGFGLYEIGRAHERGTARAIGYSFSNGYARVLAALTSNGPASTDAKAASRLLGLDWKGLFEDQSKKAQAGEQATALPAIERAGEAAVLQDINKYIIEHGLAAWNAVRQQHQIYGKTESERKHKYLTILYAQVEREEKTLGIPFQVSSTTTIGPPK